MRTNDFSVGVLHPDRETGDNLILSALPVESPTLWPTWRERLAPRAGAPAWLPSPVVGFSVPGGAADELSGR